jgi:hypothetical protein
MPSSPRYKPILPTTAQDAEREMEEAFESDDDDTHSTYESTPLTHSHNNFDDDTLSISTSSQQSPAAHRRTVSSAISGTYDFEREYDYPPPGSPPRPSARALPNDIGNSNGILPSSPVRPSRPHRSFFRKIAGAVLPTHYTRVPTDEAGTSRAVGGGIENDGVFANVMAKPQPPRVIQTEDGGVHVVPEDSQKETPPVRLHSLVPPRPDFLNWCFQTYAEAQADAVPPYWETTVHAPAGIDSSASMIIDDLPIGSFLVFCLNALFSFFFQFVGFLLTYLLHTSHAAKYGSRAGLGLTLIQLGFYSRGVSDDNVGNTTGSAESVAVGGLGSSVPGYGADPSAAPIPDDAVISVSSRDWLSFVFMTLGQCLSFILFREIDFNVNLGWFLLLSSLISFWRVKRWENALRAPPAPVTAEDVERDREMRRNIEHAFGIALNQDAEAQSAQAAAEARLTRDLRAAGLL